MDMSDLTLVIFVKDRQFNIEKNVKHYSKLNCKKIIYDSTDNACLSSSNIEELSLHGFDYIWLDSVPFIIAKTLAFTNVETEYVIQCADDDLLVISSLKIALDFLQNNPDYTTCQGVENWYDPDEATLRSTMNPRGYDNHISSNYYSADVIERIIQTFSPFLGDAHALHRTDNTKKNSKFLIEHLEYRSGVWEEIIPGILNAIHGNKKIIPNTWFVRQRILKAGVKHGLDRIISTSNNFYYDTDKIKINKTNLKPICKYLCEYIDIDFNIAYDIISNAILDSDKWQKKGQGEVIWYNKKNKTETAIKESEEFIHTDHEQLNSVCNLCINMVDTEIFNIIELIDSTAEIYINQLNDMFGKSR